MAVVTGQRNFAFEDALSRFDLTASSAGEYRLEADAPDLKMAAEQ